MVWPNLIIHVVGESQQEKVVNVNLGVLEIQIVLVSNLLVG